MRHTYDAGVVAEEEAGSTDEEAEEIGSEGAEPCAWKLRHATLGSNMYLYVLSHCLYLLSQRARKQAVV